tara:strand:- start:331 stop:528 length:198 start_codon:yes stop_codon:yes gene_type:complete
MYKSARYIRTKNNTYKLLKDFNDCVDVYVMKQEARNQNCWTDKDYVWIKDFNNILLAKQFIKERA